MRIAALPKTPLPRLFQDWARIEPFQHHSAAMDRLLGLPRVQVGSSQLFMNDCNDATIAYFFLEGLGVELSSLHHDRFVAVEELERDHPQMRPSSPGTGIYFHSPLTVRHPLEHAEAAMDYTLVNFWTQGHLYPLLITCNFDGPWGWQLLPCTEVLGRLPLRNTNLEVLLERAAEFYGLCQRVVTTRAIRIGRPCEGDILCIPEFESVYPPHTRYTEYLLNVALKSLQQDCRDGKTPAVLVVGSGSGIEAVTIAGTLGLAVDAVDINPMAVANTQASAAFTGTRHLVHAWQSDLFDAVSDRYNYVLFTSPVVANEGEAPNKRNLFDLEGRLLQRFLAGLPHHFKPNASAYLLNKTGLNSFWTPDLTVTTALQFREFGYPFAIYEIQNPFHGS